MAAPPPTRGKVRFRTTAGEWDVELWCEQAKQTCRRFLARCARGRFEHAQVERVVQRRFVQLVPHCKEDVLEEEGGPGAEVTKKEVHSRLRFDRRGILAVARPLDADEGIVDDLSFFVTLDRCSDLDGQHTIFGTVVGDGIYAIAHIGEMQVDEHDRPLECPRVLDVSILDNPFDDLDVKSLQAVREKELLEEKQVVEQTNALRQKRKRKKDATLLSFGEEAEEEESEAKHQEDLKIKSTHEIMYGRNETLTPHSQPDDTRSRQEQTHPSRSKQSMPETSPSVPSKETAYHKTKAPVTNPEPPEGFPLDSPKPSATQDSGRVEVNSALHNIHDLRAKYRAKGKKGHGQDEQETLRKLNAFCAKLRGSSHGPGKVSPSPAVASAETSEAQQTTWAGDLRSHRLEFEPKQDEDPFTPEDYVVIDPIQRPGVQDAKRR
mmetsp:Transcript_9775/g.59439  ORF Transcript_9775/g.59439 Transcript_9775/m.59439 type:complete len:435 (-) Transcript_9775:1135-2439(-)